MHYQEYTVEELVANQSFQNWVAGHPAEDVQYWEIWLATYPHQQPQMEEAAALIKALRGLQNPPLYPSRKEAAIGKVMNRIAAEPATAPVVRRVRPIYYHLLQAAAVLVLIASAGLGGWWFMYGRQPAWDTAFGETRTVTLPDGSVVTLNANSRLSLAGQWDDHSPRVVRLEGEAFFRVTRKESAGNAKFIVRTGGLEVQVLGTEFNVRQREGRTRVSLNEGKVRVNIGTSAASDGEKVAKAIVMKPGELVDFSQRDRKVVRQRINPEVYSAWTSRRYIFNDTPLREIVATLEHNYGVEVKVEDPELLDQTLTGTVVSDDLPTLLKAISATADLRIQQRNKTVTFLRNN